MTLRRISRLIWLGSIFLGLVVPLISSAAPLSLFSEGDHCVAYRARKRLFLVQTVKVVGKSCDLAVQVMPQVGGDYHIEVNVPVASFKSGEQKRDRDVTQLLADEGHAEIVFISQAYSRTDWLKIMNGLVSTLPGTLRIKGVVHSVDAKVILTQNGQGVEVDGLVKTSFKNLELTPPELGAGFFAKVRDDLELHFHLVGRRTLGADSIFPRR